MARDDHKRKKKVICSLVSLKIDVFMNKQIYYSALSVQLRYVFYMLYNYWELIGCRVLFFFLLLL